MEIRNNTPMYNRQSFGMAFRKPAADAMDSFTELVVGGFKNNKEAKKALAKIIDRQAKNAHFDLEYTYKPNRVPRGSFTIIPISPRAKEMYKEEDLLGLYALDIVTAAKYRWYNNVDVAKWWAKPFVSAKECLKIVWAKIKYVTSPEERLNRRIRYAINLADERAADINRKLANEKTIGSVFGDVVETEKVAETLKRNSGKPVVM